MLSLVLVLFAAYSFPANYCGVRCDVLVIKSLEIQSNQK